MVSGLEIPPPDRTPQLPLCCAPPATPKLLGIPAPARNHRRGKQGSANGERRGNGFHLWSPNSRLTIEPNPVISRVTPQRSRNWWLLSFKPKPGEIRSVHPEGKFQPRTGAT